MVKMEKPKDLRQELAKAIELEERDKIYKLVDKSAGVNISEPEVKGRLPKKWHHVAANCLTTPLRMSISWRNKELLEYLLNSECIITQNDKNLALQKILATSTIALSLDEIKLVKILIKHGATVGNLTHIATALHNTYHTNKAVFNALVKAFLEGDNNDLKGLLLLAFYLRDRNPRPGSAAQKHSSAEWQSEVDIYIKEVYLSGFNPEEFLKYTLVTRNPHVTARLAQALPFLLSMCTSIDIYTLAMVIRNVSFHYPLIKVESKSVIRSLCQLMVLLGYDIELINSIAGCSQRFNNVLGFSVAANNPKLLTMQQISRINIRNNITQSNVMLGVQKLELPSKLSRYLMMDDVLVL